MTNEEKAIEIANDYPMPPFDIAESDVRAMMENSALQMADWKDKQFKEYGKFLQWIHDRLEFVYHENPDMDFMRKFQQIINELFKGE